MLRVRKTCAASEVNIVEDPESGALAPDGSSPEPRLADTPRGDAAGAQNNAGDVSPGAPGSHQGEVPAQKPRRGRRRKRRRDRRVFARDAAGVAIDRPPPAAAVTEAVSRPLPVQTGAVRDARAGRGPVYAALDLGTNNCRLLVAVPQRPGQFRVIDAFSRIVRLGEGLQATGRLSDRAMDRAVEALKICALKLGSREIRLSRKIATEACRAAENGAFFLERVKNETGLELEIIDRETEARLAVSGCGSLVERETDAVVLFDIGGGSSEIALIDVSQRRSPRLANHIVSWTSLPVGVVTLAERFGGRDVTRESFEAMVEAVGEMLDGFADRHRLGPLAGGPRFHLLGTSGTVTTLAGVHLDLERYDRRRVDGLWLGNADVDTIIDRLLRLTFEERQTNPCIGVDRADLVLAGCAILEAIRRVWPSERLRVADRGLREGMLSELMADDGAWRRRRFRGGQGRT